MDDANSNSAMEKVSDTNDAGNGSSTEEASDANETNDDSSRSETSKTGAAESNFSTNTTSIIENNGEIVTSITSSAVTDSVSNAPMQSNAVNDSENEPSSDIESQLGPMNGGKE